MKIQTIILTLLILSLGGLAGCLTAQPVLETNPGMEPTLGNLIIVTVQPQATPQDNDRVPPPVGGPVRPNASLATVEVLSLATSKNNPEYVVLHVLVRVSAPAEGLDEYDPNLVGQEIDINLAAGDAVNIAAGKILILTISYRGDEWGGGYYGTDISFQD
jgi:hypothetical protein